MPRDTKNVTETEFAILNALWDRGPMAVREIVEAVYRQHTHSLHASVKSLLERLADKGYVVCQRRGGAHLFSATVEREAFVAQQLQGSPSRGDHRRASVAPLPPFVAGPPFPPCIRAAFKGSLIQATT